MANWDLLDLAQDLSDLEVALLLCLVDNEHPLIETTDDNIGDVAKELALVCSLSIFFSNRTPHQVANKNRYARIHLILRVQFWIAPPRHLWRTFGMRSLWPIPGKARLSFISNHGLGLNLYVS